LQTTGSSAARMAASASLSPNRRALAAIIHCSAQRKCSPSTLNSAG
jgi:hypothetical protein